MDERFWTKMIMLRTISDDKKLDKNDVEVLPLTREKFAAWDWTGFIEIIRVQLIRMEECWDDNKLPVAYIGQERDHKNIRTARILCDRILSNQYGEIDDRQHEAKWGTLQINDDNPLRDSYHENATTKEERDQAFKELFKIMDLEEKRKDADIKYLFELIGKEIQKWWI